MNNTRKYLIGVVGVCVVLLLVIMGYSYLHRARLAPSVQQNASAPALGTATLSSVAVDVSLNSTTLSVPTTTPVKEGDHITTSASGRAILALQHVSVIGANSDVTVKILRDNKEGLAVQAGKVWLRTQRVFDRGETRSEFSVETPEMMAAVRGTSFGIERVSGKTTVSVASGLVEVTPKNVQGQLVPERTQRIATSTRVEVGAQVTGGMQVERITDTNAGAWYGENKGGEVQNTQNDAAHSPTSPTMRNTETKAPLTNEAAAPGPVQPLGTKNIPPATAPTINNGAKAGPQLPSDGTRKATASGPSCADTTVTGEGCVSPHILRSVEPRTFVGGAAGQVISISGENLSGATSCYFDDVAVMRIRSVTDTLVECVTTGQVPPGTYGVLLDFSDGFTDSLPGAITVTK